MKFEIIIKYIKMNTIFYFLEKLLSKDIITSSYIRMHNKMLFFIQKSFC